jgi:DNA topoisomerase-6 subunit A
MSSDTDIDTDTDGDPKAETDVEDREARERLIDLAAAFYDQFAAGDVPTMAIPTRTKSNIQYDEDAEVWVYGDRESTRSANSVRGARKLLKAIYTIDFLAQQLEEDRSSTLRELYYLSESWDETEAQFADQDESNQLVEDLEIVSSVTREDFHMRPEESGATLMGPLRLREQTRRGEREIHCQEDVGEGGYQIPNNPDTIDFLRCDAGFVLCVETGGMRDRLVENGFDDDYRTVIVHLKGQPARATRRITKRLRDELGLPVLVFTDGDPWSYRIYGSIAYGSIKSAHLSEYLATPEARFVGIQPSDIVEYDLPTDPLSDSDVNALENELEDPRFQTDYWREEIELQLDIGKKAEQQSLASRGLDFVTETYLPERLSAMGVL